MEIKEYITEERVYLHDVSNQIVIAHGMAGFVLTYLKKLENAEPKAIERLEKSINALNKIVNQTKLRRDHVKSIADKILDENPT